MGRILLSLIMLFSIAACSSQAKKQVEQEKKQVRPFFTREAVIDRATDIVENAKGLSEKQKEQFIELQGDVWVEVHELNDEVKTLKVVLFKSLVSADYDDKKVEEVIEQIKVAHNKKLDLMIAAFRKTKMILGKEAKNVPFSNLWQHHGNYVRQ